MCSLNFAFVKTKQKQKKPSVASGKLSIFQVNLIRFYPLLPGVAPTRWPGLMESSSIPHSLAVPTTVQ